MVWVGCGTLGGTCVSECCVRLLVFVLHLVKEEATVPHIAYVWGVTVPLTEFVRREFPKLPSYGSAKG